MSVLSWVHILVAVCAAAQCGAAQQGPAPGPNTRLSDTLDLLWTVVDRAVKSAVEPLVTRINIRLDTLDTKLDSMQAEMNGVKSDLNLTVKSAVEPLVTRINTRLDTLDTKLDSMQAEMNGVKSDLNLTVKSAVEPLVTQLNTRLDSLQSGLIGVRSDLNLTVKSTVEPLVIRLDSLQSGLIGVRSDLNLTVKSAVEPLVTRLNTRLDSVQSELSDVTSDLNFTKTELSAQSAGLASRLDDMQTALDSLTELSSQQLELVSTQVAVLSARDCSDLPAGTASGLHLVKPELIDPVLAYCDMETDGGGWTVFQRRADVQPHEDFYRDWDDYKQGFGDLRREFWWGNDNIWRTTSVPDRRYTLRIDMGDFEGERRYAVYQNFSIASEADGYRLTVGNYSGNAGDSLTPNYRDHIHAGMRFSTKDRDHDNDINSCARVWKGAWWYNKCHSSHLNGLYLEGATSLLHKGVTWKTWRGQGYSLKSVEMKIRPVQ